LLVFIDDATGKLMQLRFVPSESTSSYFDCLRGYLDAHGCPVAFYSDKHTVFRINRETQGGQDMTQFGRALDLFLIGAGVVVDHHVRDRTHFVLVNLRDEGSPGVAAPGVEARLEPSLSEEEAASSGDLSQLEVARLDQALQAQVSPLSSFTRYPFSTLYFSSVKKS
jgi:hypothetical protein